jgi:hypothetical protein
MTVVVQANNSRLKRKPRVNCISPPSEKKAAVEFQRGKEAQRANEDENIVQMERRNVWALQRPNWIGRLHQLDLSVFAKSET